MTLSIVLQSASGWRARPGTDATSRQVRRSPLALPTRPAYPATCARVATGCALCDSVCPSNAGTTLFDSIEALSIDIGNAVRVVGKCFAGGFAGCVCNILLALKPAWIDQLPSPQSRCSGGNIFGLLVSKILEMIMQSSEDVLNGFIVDPINAVLGSLPWPLSYLGDILPRVCLTGFWKPGGNCWEGDEQMAAYLGCYATERSAASRQCYFTRCARATAPFPGTPQIAYSPTRLPTARSQAKGHLPGSRRALRPLPAPLRGAERRRPREPVPEDRGRLVRVHRPDVRRPLQLRQLRDAHRRRAAGQGRLRQLNL